jgi:hypothetical protein
MKKTIMPLVVVATAAAIYITGMTMLSTLVVYIIFFFQGFLTDALAILACSMLSLVSIMYVAVNASRYENLHAYVVYGICSEKLGITSGRFYALLGTDGPKKKAGHV